LEHNNTHIYTYVTDRKTNVKDRTSWTEIKIDADDRRIREDRKSDKKALKEPGQIARKIKRMRMNKKVYLLYCHV
jgi:hypothetical protein